MLDRLLFIALVLNASGIFRFIAPLVGLSIGQVTMALFALNCLYLVAKANHVIPMIQHRGMGRWLCLLLLWPLATLVYAPSFDAREIGLQFYFFSLFLSTVAFVRLNGLGTMYKILTASLIITFIGMPLSVIAPEIFAASAEAADARLEQLGRPIGFFLQPNRLAFCLCWLFIAWFALCRRKSVVLEVMVVILFLGLVLSTGSRGGVLVAGGVAAILFSFKWRVRLLRGRLLVSGVLLLLSISLGGLGLRAYLDQRSDTGHRRHGDLIDRMETMLNLQLSTEGSIAEDVSLEARLSAQATYFNYILEEPVLGRGFGSNSHYLDTGRIFLSAHSEALTRAFEFGIFYPLALWLAVAGLYFKKERKAIEHGLGTNAVAQFTSAFFVIFGYASIMEEGRVFCIVLGLFYALLHYPQFLLHRDEATGLYGAPLSRREIRRRRQPLSREEKSSATSDAPKAEGTAP